jgi:cytochrome oxidase assembly protein ShyY1
VDGVLRTGAAPTAAHRYTRVLAAGRYDTANEVLVRGRTVGGRVGFEVVTPLVLDSGAALLVNRGWVPPARGAADVLPQVPPAPPGRVEVVGAVRLPENGPGRVDRRDGRLVTRRIDPAKLAPALPYPVLGGYVTTEQSGLTPIGVAYEGTLQNGGYALQWWAFAALTLVGYAYLARRHAHPPGPRGDRLDDPAEPERDHAGTG